MYQQMPSVGLLSLSPTSATVLSHCNVGLLWTGKPPLLETTLRACLWSGASCILWILPATSACLDLAQLAGAGQGSGKMQPGSLLTLELPGPLSSCCLQHLQFPPQGTGFSYTRARVNDHRQEGGKRAEHSCGCKRRRRRGTAREEGEGQGMSFLLLRQAGRGSQEGPSPDLCSCRAAGYTWTMVPQRVQMNPTCSAHRYPCSSWDWFVPWAGVLSARGGV